MIQNAINYNGMKNDGRMRMMSPSMMIRQHIGRGSQSFGNWNPHYNNHNQNNEHEQQHNNVNNNGKNIL